MVNSYTPGCFTIELDEKCYPIAHDLTIQDSHIRSALLHEYVHYLQDTVTYYGVIYRSECYNNAVDKQIAGGNDASKLGSPYIPGDKFGFNNEGKLEFEGEIVGATAIKENMARQAELFIFGELKGTSYNAMTYKSITMYAQCHSAKLSKHPLAMFVIDDCCLGTSDPSQAIVTIIENIDIETVESHLAMDDQALVSWLYPYIHDLLRGKNILIDQPINTTQFEADEWKTVAYTGIAKQLYQTEEIFRAHSDEASVLIEKIEKSYHYNASLRVNEPALLANCLIEFKQNNDFLHLFAKFGTPLIKKSGTCDSTLSNIDVIIS